MSTNEQAEQRPDPPRLTPNERGKVARVITWDKSAQYQQVRQFIFLAARLAQTAGIPILFAAIPKVANGDRPSGEIVFADIPEDPDGVVTSSGFYVEGEFSAVVETFHNFGDVDGVPCAISPRFLAAVDLLEGRAQRQEGDPSTVDEVCEEVGVRISEERLRFANEYTTNEPGNRRLSVAFPAPLSVMPPVFLQSLGLALSGEVFGPYSHKDEQSEANRAVMESVSTDAAHILDVLNSGVSPSFAGTIFASLFMAFESLGDARISPGLELSALSAFDPSRILTEDEGGDNVDT